MSEHEERDSLPVRRARQFELEEPYGGWGPPSAWAPEEEEGVDFERLFDLLMRRKWWILLATGLGVAAGAFLMRTAPATYETEATIWVQARNRQQSNQTGPIEAPEVLEGQGWTDLFTSRAVLEPVVRDQKLFLHLPDTTAATRALFADFDVSDSVQGGRYSLSVDSSSHYVLKQEHGPIVERGALGDSVGADIGFLWRPRPDQLAPGAEVDFGVSSPAHASQQLRNDLTIKFNPNAGNLVTTRFTWYRAEQSATILNSVIRSFLNVARDLKTENLREKVQILKQQSDYAASRLDSAENALERVRVANITLPSQGQAGSGSGSGGGTSSQDPVFEAYFQKKVTLSQLDAQISELQDALGRLRSGQDLGVMGLQSIPAVDSSPALSGTLAALNDKMARRQTLLLTYTEQYPEVQKVTQDIQELKTQVLPGQISGLLGQLQDRRSAVQGQVESQASDLRRIPPRAIEEARLQRKVDLAEQLHNDLLVRLKEAELATSTGVPDLQVVDRATPPARPTSDQGPRYFLLASMAGLGLGVGGVLLLDKFDRRFRYPDQVPGQLGLPVLGVIPNIRGGRRVGHGGTESVIEAFRVVRTQLTRRRSETPTIIVITSPTPRDGKTLVSSNLAISFAAANGNTLLVDGDVRRGDANRLFGMPASPGLTESLSRGGAIEDSIRRTDVPGLAFLPHGKLTGFDPVLLEGDRLVRTLEDLRKLYDVVVIDAPPLVAGTDPLILGELADQVVIVLRTGETDMQVTRARLEGMGSFDLPLAGLVLNDVPDRKLYQKYYSSYQYYVEGEVVA